MISHKNPDEGAHTHAHDLTHFNRLQRRAFSPFSGGTYKRISRYLLCVHEIPTRYPFFPNFFLHPIYLTTSSVAYITRAVG